MSDNTSERKRAKSNPKSARVHQWALSVQFALGLYLWLVPDGLFFFGTQLIVLTHVLTALIWLPLFCAWLVRHVVRSGPRPLRRLTGRGRPRGLFNTGLLALVVLALVSGVWVIGSSQGMPAAYFHGIAGAGVVLVLLLHYAIEARHHLVRASLVVVSLLVVAGALRLSVPMLESTPSYAGEATLAPDSAYDEAAWCGSCHEEIYAEWQVSAHGRALVDRNIRDELEDEAHERPLNVEGDLAFMHALAEGDAEAKARLGNERFDPCVHCHAPTSFYGDSTQPILSATDSAGDGISCSFCHTLQDVDVGGFMDLTPEKLKELGPKLQDIDFINDLFANKSPRYVSKPQRVRRYFGQNADGRLARMLGDTLIRWRPEVHRQDYHPKLLGTSEACLACHGSYLDWANSRYAGDAEHPPVDCQDCHMVRELTGEAHREPGRHVAWGPMRSSRRSHLMLGGNLSHIGEAAPADYAAAQRAFRARALRLWIAEVARPNAETLAVTVGLENLAVGHDYPERETPVRFSWVRVEARGPDDEVLGATPVFEGHPQSDDPPDNVIVYYRKLDGLDVRWDRTLPPDGSRTDTVTLAVPAGAEVARVVAYLHANTDPFAPAIVVSHELDGR